MRSISGWINSTRGCGRTISRRRTCPKLMEFLHRRGVKGYVTFNTLIFQNEVADAESYLRAIIAAGVDAAIVQDVGVCRLIRSLSPDFPIHASTQMTISSAAGIEFARNLGCDLAVLARECSITEIEKIRAADAAVVAGATGARGVAAGSVRAWRAVRGVFGPMLDERIARGPFGEPRRMCAERAGCPTISSAMASRCRLGINGICSVRRICPGWDVLPELVKAGVSSLKIEGRLKSPEYVASITRVYRKRWMIYARMNLEFRMTIYAQAGRRMVKPRRKAAGMILR